MEENYICADCVGEPYLRTKILENGSRKLCWHCGKEGPGMHLNWLADTVYTAFETHYVTALPVSVEYQRLADMLELNYPYSPKHVRKAIAYIAIVSEIIAEKIRAQMAAKPFETGDYKSETTPPYNPNSWYSFSPPSHAYYDGWNEFESELKSKARYFNQKALDFLNDIFGDITELEVEGADKIIESAGPGCRIDSLFRARVFQKWDGVALALISPDEQLGRPASNVAGSGRMNAKGIPVFYGALEEETAIAEVRPPVGSNVVIAKFKIIKPLKLLNLPALASIKNNVSIFDPIFAKKYAKSMFLYSLSDTISRPVMPDDAESEYLATQYIAEYLASRSELDVNGIIFPSAQIKGGNKMNVVLFNKSSKVEELPKFKEGSIKVRAVDNFDDYTLEWLNADIGLGDEIAFILEDPFEFGETPIDHFDEDYRNNSLFEISEDVEPSLSIDKKTIQIFQINSVEYTVLPKGILWKNSTK